MLNVGPKPDGTIPVEAQNALQGSGEWIKKYPQTIYNAGPSPWGRMLPWGDVTVTDGKLNLCIYDWPLDGEIVVPGLKNTIRSAGLWVDGKIVPVQTSKNGNWTIIRLPAQRPEKLVSVVQLEVEGEIDVDKTLSIDPVYTTELLIDFAEAENCNIEGKRWMEKFGEWKHIGHAHDWKNDSKVIWEVDVMESGYYQADLNYAGNGRMVWRIENDEGTLVQNEQNSSAVYKYYEMGLLKFDKPGRHTITVSFIEGDAEAASLKQMRLTPLSSLE